MKTENNRKPNLLLVITLILFLPVWEGCEKTKIAIKEGKMSLSDLPEDTSYTSLSLIGTPWRLVGFADSKQNIIKLSELFLRQEDFFLLTFNQDGLISGFTSSNKAGGRYNLKNFNGIGIDFGVETYAGENDDGYRYIEAMNKVSSYQISAKGLSLYYGKDTYLLFHPTEDK